MDKFSFEAVILDLDGVITGTATVHSQAWKKMFDEFLQDTARRDEKSFKSFDLKDDYLNYVDGKPRYKGVESFLKSRDITIPYGKHTDSPEKNTICGLGNRKNILFNKLLEYMEVKVFKTTVDFIRELKDGGIKVGVASSSESCKKILKKTGLLELFDVFIDGIISRKLNLKGKPEPDIFLAACSKLEVNPGRCVIIEDAVSGVRAGMKGGFGLVVGVDRQKNKKYLKASGADIVVKDLGELNIYSIEEYFKKEKEIEKWSISYTDYSREKESIRESLCAVGNGYFGTRGALEESRAGKVNYPGTYIAGVYNKLKTKIGDKSIENEDMVNCPNWLPLTFKIGNGEWVNFSKVKISYFKRRLNFREGTLFRKVIIKDDMNRETLIESKRLASMANPHTGAIKYNIVPLNYSGSIIIKSEIDGSTINSGVKRYKGFKSRHYDIVKQGTKKNVSFILARTNQSQIDIAVAAGHIVSIDGREIKPAVKVDSSGSRVITHFNLQASEASKISVEKIVSIHTSKDIDAKKSLTDKSIDYVGGIGSFDSVLRGSKKIWNDIWKEIDIKIRGDNKIQQLIRLNLYHLIITVSPHNINIDAGFPARGLHGEAYRGHIFWDELFILPFYNIHFPEVSKSILLYRYRRLEMAKRNAESRGSRGALYPWQSGSDGSEQSQIIHLNPVSGKWNFDYSALQYHINLAIALNIWHYYQMTGDIDFIAEYGAEIFFEVCRFWTDWVRYNKEKNCFEIEGVMGPDEYHEKYPGSDRGGLKNNSYTNIMVAWLFRKAIDILDILDKYSKNYVTKKINLKSEEVEKWKDIGKKIKISMLKNGLIPQFDGYFDLEELDWKEYLGRSGKKERMDRLLKAGGTSPDEYKISKQADTLMVFYNLGPGEAADIINECGNNNYYKPKDILKVNFDYYIKQTSHDSTLSLIVHSCLAYLLGYKKIGQEFYEKALNSDYKDIQTGTTGEGIHTGVMGGVILMTLKFYAGVNFNSEHLNISPFLPGGWEEISFNFILRKIRYSLQITGDKIRILVNSNGKDYIKILVCDREYSIKTQKWQEIKLPVKN